MVDGDAGVGDPVDLAYDLDDPERAEPLGTATPAIWWLRIGAVVFVVAAAMAAARQRATVRRLRG